MLDRQAYVNDHFAKGKLYFDGGKYEEASAEWNMILSSLTDEAKLKPLLDELLANIQKLKSMKLNWKQLSSCT